MRPRHRLIRAWDVHSGAAMGPNGNVCVTRLVVPMSDGASSKLGRAGDLPCKLIAHRVMIPVGLLRVYGAVSMLQPTGLLGLSSQPPGHRSFIT